MKPDLKERYENMLKEAKSPGSGCSKDYIQHLQKILDGKADIFKYHKYSPFDSDWEKERREKMQRTEENLKRLNGCSRHDFKRKTEEEGFTFITFIDSKEWECSKCKGTVTSIEKEWYEKGVENRMNEEKFESIAKVLFDTAFAAWSINLKKMHDSDIFSDLNKPEMGDYVFEISNPFTPRIRSIGKLVEHSNSGSYVIECLDGKIHTWENAKFVKVADEKTISLTTS
ncbi:hypothetical protein MZM54_05275 [[Brevibacterium] frigoritolerans]|nr:hypothetical protein [Peribacillus frigoritolerans]